METVDLSGNPALSDIVLSPLAARKAAFATLKHINLSDMQVNVGGQKVDRKRDMPSVGSNGYARRLQRICP